MNESDRIAQLESKLESTQYVLEQILDGLFNKFTQGDVLKRHMDDLYQRNKYDEPIREAPMLHVSPSTRQGDVLQLRMNVLEEKVISLQEILQSKNTIIRELETKMEELLITRLLSGEANNA